MFHSRQEGGQSAHTLPPPPAQIDELPQHVREHLRKLRVILPVISVSVMALHRQNAELDRDIATVLAEHACEPLDFEIDHLESMLITCALRRRPQEVCS